MRVELDDEEVNVLLRCIAAQEHITPQNAGGLYRLVEKLTADLSDFKMKMPKWWRSNR